jgi:hypothetical protein
VIDDAAIPEVSGIVPPLHQAGCRSGPARGRRGPVPGASGCRLSWRSPGGTVAWSGSVILPSPAGTADTVRIGKGAYAAPANGVPAWAIALLAIGAAILIALSWLLVLYFRRARGAGNTAP